MAEQFQRTPDGNKELFGVDIGEALVFQEKKYGIFQSPFLPVPHHGRRAQVILLKFQLVPDKGIVLSCFRQRAKSFALLPAREGIFPVNLIRQPIGSVPFSDCHTALRQSWRHCSVSDLSTASCSSRLLPTRGRRWRGGREGLFSSLREGSSIAPSIAAITAL